ncbi:MAG: anti-sigma factor family protein [Desulfovermiculus sp.]
MKNEELIEQIMNWFAGELTAAEVDDLMAALARHPDLQAHAHELKCIWDAMEQAMPPVQDETRILQRVYRRTVLGQDTSTLSDEDLDKAAGGIWPFDPQGGNPDSDQNK